MADTDVSGALQRVFIEQIVSVFLESMAHYEQTHLLKVKKSQSITYEKAFGKQN